MIDAWDDFEVLTHIDYPACGVGGACDVAVSRG
jgi:hypothetical protein